MVCQHGGKHQQMRQSLWAKLSGMAWENQRFAALPRSHWSLLQWTAAACCSQEFAPTTSHFAFPRARLLTWVFKGFRMPETKTFHNTSALISWGLCLLEKPQFFLKLSWDKSSQPVLFLINFNAWSYSLMRQIRQSCPSFQYFTFHCVFH